MASSMIRENDVPSGATLERLEDVPGDNNDNDETEPKRRRIRESEAIAPEAASPQMDDPSQEIGDAMSSLDSLVGKLRPLAALGQSECSFRATQECIAALRKDFPCVDSHGRQSGAEAVLNWTSSTTITVVLEKISGGEPTRLHLRNCLLYTSPSPRD